jgi:hypothetical protein
MGSATVLTDGGSWGRRRSTGPDRLVSVGALSAKPGTWCWRASYAGLKPRGSPAYRTRAAQVTGTWPPMTTYQL